MPDTLPNQAVNQESPPAEVPEGESKPDKSAEVLGWAKERGYIPEEEWKGSSEKYVPLDKWLVQYEESLPFIKHQRSKLERQLIQMQREVANTQASMKSVVDHLKSDMDSKWKAKMDEMEEQYAEAVAAGDKDNILRLGKQIRKVEQQVVQQRPQQPPPADIPAYAIAWKDENPWFGSDRVATAMAQAKSEELEAEGFTGKALLNQVTEFMREERPRLFSDSPTHSRVESPTRGGRTSSVKYRVTDITPELMVFVGKGKAWETPQEWVNHMNKQGD